MDLGYDLLDWKYKRAFWKGAGQCGTSVHSVAPEPEDVSLWDIFMCMCFKRDALNRSVEPFQIILFWAPINLCVLHPYKQTHK